MNSIELNFSMVLILITFKFIYFSNVVLSVVQQCHWYEEHESLCEWLWIFNAKAAQQTFIKLGSDIELAFRLLYIQKNCSIHMEWARYNYV